jgi:uncharacterized protein involved in outer membrane biogenesis
MKKKLLIAVGILIAIPILILFAAVLFIDPIVRTAVGKGASMAFKVPAHLDRASIRWSGQATLEGFEMGNPPGYREPRALAFERVEAAARPRDLLGNVVHVGEVTIVKPDLTLEFVGSKNNLSALLDNLPGARVPGKEKEGGEAKPSGKKFMIHRVRIVDPSVRFRSDLLGGEGKTLTLPPLELENVGTASGGATMGEILGVVLQALGNSALKAGEGILPPQLLDNLRSGIRDLPGRSLEELKKSTEQLKSKELDPAEIEKRLRGRQKPKSAD